MPGKLLAISDLHVAYPENRAFVEALRPESHEDWLLVAGDVAETFIDIGWALTVLRQRFTRVVWAPGNHELWTSPRDPVQLRGVERYEALVRMCRALDVDTPEDPYPVWRDEIVIAPLFLLYDYSWQAPVSDPRVVARDEELLHPDPYPSRTAWCHARVADTQARLAALGAPTILVNHFPLVREPTRILRHPHFAQWCGTDLTADWHTRFDARAVVYGHLHIPRSTAYNGVPFEEVSLGYPREWRPRRTPPRLREIYPRS